VVQVLRSCCLKLARLPAAKTFPPALEVRACVCVCGVRVSREATHDGIGQTQT
jgi:hypothetical protein